MATTGPCCTACRCERQWDRYSVSRAVASAFMFFGTGGELTRPCWLGSVVVCCRCICMHMPISSPLVLLISLLCCTLVVCWLCIYTQGIEQSSLLQRLGPARLFNPAHASCHWVLDLMHPAHVEVAKKLVRE